MKWWFTSWNLFLFSLSKVCRISSADCLISGFTASQSPQLRLRSIVGYTLLISILFFFAFASKVFLYVLHWKAFLKNIFNLCPTSFFCLLHFVLHSVFCSYESTKDKLSLYHIWTVTSRFVGVFRKSFYSHTIIGKLRAVCRGISRKFYKKIAENFSRQPHTKRKSDIIQTSFSVFIKLFFIVLNLLK